MTASGAGRFRASIGGVRRQPMLLVGIVIFVVLLLASAAAPWLAPHDPYAQDLSQRLIPPAWDVDGGWDHLLGTDGFGRDYLSRLLFGGRISLLVGVSTMVISGVIGTGLGIMAGYFGGSFDLFVSFLLSVRLSLPVVLVALVAVSLVGNSLQVVMLVLSLLLWDRFAVVMRSATLQVRGLDFVAAAAAIGSSTARILWREILPNVTASLIVVATVEMNNAVLLEAALSFLGLGVQPPLPSWGLMVAEARGVFFFAPWALVIPGLALFLLVLSVNLLGDGIRALTRASQGRG